MYRSVPFNVVKMMPMTDAFSYQPITSVSRIVPPSDDVIARIADGLRISFNLFNPRSISANGVPVRSHLRHSKDSKRLNKASSVTGDAPRVFSLLSCFMVLQGSGLQVILGIFDLERVNGPVVYSDRSARTRDPDGKWGNLSSTFAKRPAPARLAGDSNRFSFSRRLREPTRPGAKCEQRRGYRLLRPKQRTKFGSNAEGSTTKKPKTHSSFARPSVK